jgi:ABC-type transport system substrate-binding protein
VISNTAEALPVITEGGKTWTIKLKRGILFAHAPAFKGKPRELVAEDYVYSIKRSIDPHLLTGGDPAAHRSDRRRAADCRRRAQAGSEIQL